MRGVRHRLALSLAALAAAGCGGDDSTAPAPPMPPQPAPPGGACRPATTALMNPLASKLSGRAILENGQTVPSAEQEGFYFVSAELEGPAFVGAGQIATWATRGLGGEQPIYAVDELAKQHSDWEDAEAVGLSLADEGAVESRRCVSR